MLSGILYSFFTSFHLHYYTYDWKSYFLRAVPSSSSSTFLRLSLRYCLSYYLCLSLHCSYFMLMCHRVCLPLFLCVCVSPINSLYIQYSLFFSHIKKPHSCSRFYFYMHNNLSSGQCCCKRTSICYRSKYSKYRSTVLFRGRYTMEIYAMHLIQS